jgi:membrane-associated phospholipid phosphatase
MTAITPVWQISFHGAAAGALITTTLILCGMSTWPLLTLLPLMGWSQVERGRHTAAQVVAGALLAALLYGLGFSL